MKRQCFLLGLLHIISLVCAQEHFFSTNEYENSNPLFDARRLQEPKTSRPLTLQEKVMNFRLSGKINFPQHSMDPDSLVSLPSESIKKMSLEKVRVLFTKMLNEDVDFATIDAVISKLTPDQAHNLWQDDALVKILRQDHVAALHAKSISGFFNPRSWFKTRRLGRELSEVMKKSNTYPNSVAMKRLIADMRDVSIKDRQDLCNAWLKKTNQTVQTSFIFRKDLAPLFAQPDGISLALNVDNRPKVFMFDAREIKPTEPIEHQIVLRIDANKPKVQFSKAFPADLKKMLLLEYAKWYIRTKIEPLQGDAQSIELAKFDADYKFATIRNGKAFMNQDIFKAIRTEILKKALLPATAKVAHVVTY